MLGCCIPRLPTQKTEHMIGIWMCNWFYTPKQDRCARRCAPWADGHVWRRKFSLDADRSLDGCPLTRQRPSKREFFYSWHNTINCSRSFDAEILAHLEYLCAVRWTRRTTNEKGVPACFMLLTIFRCDWYRALMGRMGKSQVVSSACTKIYS